MIITDKAFDGFYTQYQSDDFSTEVLEEIAIRRELLMIRAEELASKGKWLQRN